MANTSLKRVLVGRPLPSHKAEHQLLPKRLALPIFASDALSSNAYATQEMMLVLAAAGAGALGLRIPLAIAIAVVLAIVVASYRQTVRAYPMGGGSYIVAHDNLGTTAGLTAAAAVLVDYALTVAVSVTAGSVAITSAVPSLADDRVALSTGLVALLTLANLRGVKEAGALFALPTYGFIVMVLFALGTGFVRCLSECPTAATTDLPIEATSPLAVLLVLRAFSSGATALTGVEAIADGVQAFRRPHARNAATTLSLMAAVTLTMFIGITVMTALLDIRIDHHIAETRSVLSQIGETVFGRGFAFYALQALTAGILILAANTAYQDFPRLSAILARDRFMPSQFKNRGDRLVFSNGIVILAVAASALVYAFDADLTGLIQLYVVGVFTAFTLSQSGMVRRWLRLRTPGWRWSMALNALGATATGVVLVIVTITKFVHGAWIVIAAMPVIILFFKAVHRHYASIDRALRIEDASPAPTSHNTFVLPVRDLGSGTAKAVRYIRAVRPERVVPLYVGDPETYEPLAERWPGFAPRLGPLQRLDPGDGRPIPALRARLRALRGDDGFVTVVLAEELASRSLLRHLWRRWGFWLKLTLFFEPGVVVSDVPALPEERSHPIDRPLEPGRHVVLVPVSSVRAPTVAAISYALSLEATEVRAVFFSTDPGDEGELVKGWLDHRMSVPLSIVDAPFRDLAEPMLDEVRHHTATAGTVVTVVLPEVVVAHWWEQLLHTQSALFFKRLLLFEPDVVVTSVPFHVDEAPERRSAGVDATGAR